MSEQPEDYSRQVEAYLCRKNDGHLIRIVGPVFEQVCGWALRGVPLKVAFAGIDRSFERYYAKGPRRRPLRIEFCEADILDVFDEWRRALGIPMTDVEPPVTLRYVESINPPPEPAAAEEPVRRPSSLAAHIERVIARLTALRAGEDRSLDATLDAIVRELDVARGDAKSARGESRQRLIDRLRELDGTLLDAARTRYEGVDLERLAAEADAELTPFRSRMAPDAYETARRAAINQLIRERVRLPVLAFE